MKEVEELAGRLARVQGGKTVNKNTERMYGARRTLRRVWTVHVILNLLKSETESSKQPRSVRGCSRVWFL